jgi:hypothetical protein
MKVRILLLTILLFVLWIFNSYRHGDFQNTESMAQMDARVNALPHAEFSEKKEQAEFDLEEYSKTVNSMNNIVQERIKHQINILDEDSQIQLRPVYDIPRNSDNQYHELNNPPPVPKLPNIR